MAMGRVDRPRISVIVATCDRPTLKRAIRSSRWADEIVVVFDAADPPRRPRGCVVAAVGPTHVWGGPQRNHGMTIAGGTHFAFMDDDDAYTRAAGNAIRAAVLEQPDRVHVFRMRNGDKVYSGPIASGAISTQMFVVPRAPVGAFTNRYGDDFDFISETMRLRDDEPVYHPTIVATIRPLTWRRVLSAATNVSTQRRVLTRWLRRARARLGPGPRG